MYEVVFSRSAAKLTRSLPKSHREKLRRILEAMKDNPFSQPYRKIRGETNLYRIRLGGFRVLYEIDDQRKRVVVLKIDRRSRVYKR